MLLDKRAWALLLRCLVAWMIVVQGGAQLPARAAGGALVRIAQAEFRVDDTAAWEDVRLPDSWHQRLPQLPESGLYRFSLDVQPQPGVVYAMRFERLSDSSGITLNGQLIDRRERQDRTDHVIRSSPALVQVPSALLRAGRNEVVLTVRHGKWPRAGLSVVEFGEEAVIEARHEAFKRERHDLPIALNVVAGTFATLLIFIWLARRSEVGAALFGACALLSSLRNISYFGAPVLSAVAGDLVGYLSNVMACSFSLMFALHATGGCTPRRRWVLWLISALLCAAATGIVSMAPGATTTLRLVTYPLLFGLLSLTVVVFARHAWRQRSVDSLALALGYAVTVGAGLHDFAFVAGRTHPDDTFWAAYVMPLLFIVYAGTLLRRMLRAMHEVEDLRAGLEERVNERTAELAEANAAKTRFLAAASHDLRQPMHAISLLVGLARERSRRPEMQLLIDRVQTSVNHMGDLLKGLLDISRLDAGALKTEVTTFHLQELFAAVQASEGPLAEAKGLRLRFAPTQAVVRSDRRLLEGMLRNLVANAVRYTGRGGVLVGVRRHGDACLLQVHDTGVGIAPEHQPLVFREFFQVDNPQRDRTLGLGLGLSIVKRAADLLGHALRLRSVPGRGSSFEIELPRAAPWAALQPVDVRLPAATPTGVGDRLAGSFVLVIEDDTAVREALAALLRHWQCHVLDCASLAEADTALDQHLRDPDLVLTDYRLPGQSDGLAAIEQLRARVGALLPALVVTGDMAPAELRRLRDSGVPVLFKPLQAVQLRQALDELLAAEVR